jgi:hypothetical protein
MSEPFTQRKIGTTLSELQSNIQWNRAENDTVIRRWHGSISEIDALRSSLQAPLQAESYNLTQQDDGTARLEASFLAENALAQWELVGTEINNDIRFHPRFIPIWDHDLQRILRQINNYNSVDSNGVWVPESDLEIYTIISENGGGKYPGYDATSPNGLVSDAILYLDLARRGITSYFKDQYTLRRTFWVTDRWQGKIAFNNVLRLYSKADLNTEFTAQGTPFPPELAFALEDITVEHPERLLVASDPQYERKRNYVTRWLKKRPTYTSQGGGPRGLRFQVQQEWVLDTWNRRLYYPADLSNTPIHPDDSFDDQWLPDNIV